MAQEQLAFPLRVPDRVEDDGRLRNWARNATLGRAGSLTTPADEDELRAFLASTTGATRIIGTRMSPGRLIEAIDGGGSLIDVRRLTGLVSLTDDTATFGGATPLQEVYDVLSGHRRMLPSSPGVIASQTLAGAISTGTHGQGLQQGSIADAALRIRLVLADGSVREFDRDDPWFHAVALGLGSLGVITRVTLRTLPSLVYACRKYAVAADDLEHEFETWNRENLLLKAWWFVQEGQVQVWAAREASEDDVQRYRTGGDELIEDPVSSDAMNGAIEQTLVRMRDDARSSDADYTPFRTVTRFRDFADVTGDVYQVFCRGIPAPQINVEIAVPLARAGDAIEKIKKWYAETRPRLHYPIILRCTGPSEAWLSPAHGRETCYFGFVVYYAEDGSLPAEGEEFLRAVEKLLAAEGGTPHWGKYFDESLYDWPSRYPRWRDFARVREALDPGHRFGNAFTTSLFSSSSSETARSDLAPGR